MSELDDLSVLIIDGNDWLSVCVLRCLARIPNVKVHVLASHSETEARFCRHRASFRLHAESVDDEEYLKIISETTKIVKADVLFPVSRIGIGFAAKHTRALKQLARLMPVPDLQVFDTADDKWELSQFMLKEGIPAPHTLLWTRDAFFERALDSMRFPVLIKPTRSGNGDRIRAFKDRGSLKRFMETLREDTRPYIIQSRVSGYDIGCSVFCKNERILAHTIQKDIVENPTTFRPSLAYEFVRNEKVLAVVSQLIRGLNFNGVAHVDLRVDETDGEVKVIEVNPRYWSSLTGSLIAGVNFPQLALYAALEKPLPKYEYRLCRHMEAQGMLKKWVYGVSDGKRPSFRPSEIDWESVFFDPLPLLWMSWKILKKSLAKFLNTG